MPANSTHADYDCNLVGWLRARDVIAGEDAVKAGGVKYLPRLDSQTDDEYNAYNYMVLTAQSKPAARARIPAVIHADGTGRVQIVREQDDPLTYAYLKALGRRIGVEVSVNTSFNVAGPIAQTPNQAIDTLRRSRGLDVVMLVASDGAVHAAWHGGNRDSGRFISWFSEWKSGREHG